MRGARLDAFILDVRLGGGGMGEVYKALHEPSGRFVAIKLLTGKDQAQRERLRRSVSLEAEALARLSHPGVVAVLDRGVVGRDADSELIPGAPWLAIDIWKHIVFIPRYDSDFFFFTNPKTYRVFKRCKYNK